MVLPGKNLKKEGFSRAERIVKKNDFDTVFKHGKRIRRSFFQMVIQPRDADVKRIGIIVSKKKIGCAVERNRIKRIIREIFRKSKAVIPPSDTVLVASPPLKLMKYREIESAFLAGFSSLPPSVISKEQR